MIEAINANLTNDFVYAKKLTGRIHSKFKSVINVIFDQSKGINQGLITTRLVTIVTPEFSGIPDSVVISKKDFELLSQLSLDDRVIKKESNMIFGDSYACHMSKSRILSSQLYFEGNHRSEGRLRELFVRLEQRTSQGIKSDGFGMTYEEQYDRLSGFALGLMSYNLQVSIRAFTSNLGRGKGLTPSSDDAMVGIMAYTMGASISNLLEPGNRYLSFAQEMINQVNLKEYTTDVSAKYLYSAAEGRFSHDLQELIRWIFHNSREDIQTILNQIVQMGSTSGMDLLAGIRIANEVYLRNSSGI